MIIQHHFIIHFINMISGKDQNIFRIITFHIAQILINGIRCTCIPLTACTLLIWRKYRNTALISIQIPRNTNSDMRIQTQRLILCQYTNCVDTRINTVT